ncbi:peptidylprolyl isomerase [Novosphingobium rosa]|uniref:peptidylprolyl isomerase n=1 Tax=Novosphingobium rosa TaxID=76978 RepID=UPI000A017A08|nr:peptidylprolyl isomerase [Novosphingobium rosa]
MKSKNRVSFPRAGVALSVAMALMLPGTALMAQGQPGAQGAAEAGGPGGDPFNLPDTVTLFGKNTPNLRRATAIVNGDIITGTDVDQRLALVIAANGGKISDEERTQLRAQVLRNLIDETLQIQEAKSADATIDDSEVNDTFARVAQENFHQDVNALDAYLARVGSSSASLKRQIKGELAWQRVLRKNVQPFINVSQEEVKELIAKMQAQKGTDEYHVGEIYLSATQESKPSVAANANRIMDQLRQGGSFVAYARQYSEASTKVVGGDLGWVRLSQLPTELAAAARDMQPGQLTGPVEMRGGFSIIYMIDKRKVLTADPRDAILALKQISIDFPKGTSEADANKRATEFSAAIKGAKGCGGVDAAAQKIGANVVANDQVKARDLPAALQQTVLAMQPGDSTQPFGSVTEGVRMLMLCGREEPKDAGAPNFDQVLGQMEDERVNRRAQLYMRDLRRDAIIEYN